MPATTIQFFIRAGQSLSEPVDLTAKQVAPQWLITPPQWSPALLSFQISYDGSTYFDVMREKGDEAMVNFVPGVAYRTDTGLWLPLGMCKVRSGTRKTPIPQEADRKFTIVFVAATTVAEGGA